MHAYECLGSPRKSYELAGSLGNSLEVLASQPADCNQVMHEQGAGLDAAPGTGLLDGVAVRLRCATAPQLSCTIPGMPRILECLDRCFCIVTVGFD